MPNWDEDSPQLRENLARVLAEIAREAELRAAPTIEAARQWQSRVMEGLGVPNERYVGAFRGERGLENVQVRVGANRGVVSTQVADELKRFESTLQTLSWTNWCRSVANWMLTN